MIRARGADKVSSCLRSWGDSLVVLDGADPVPPGAGVGTVAAPSSIPTIEEEVNPAEDDTPTVAADDLQGSGSQLSPAGHSRAASVQDSGVGLGGPARARGGSDAAGWPHRENYEAAGSGASPIATHVRGHLTPASAVKS